MKKKGFTLMELLVTFLILAILVAIILPIIRGRRNIADEKAFKTEFLASEEFKQIVGDPNQVKKAKLTVDVFQDYMHEKNSHLQLAKPEDVEGYLEQKKQSAMGLSEEEEKFENELLTALLEKSAKKK